MMKIEINIKRNMKMLSECENGEFFIHNQKLYRRVVLDYNDNISRGWVRGIGLSVMKMDDGYMTYLDSKEVVKPISDNEITIIVNDEGGI